ncbi:MAG: PAS domain S-box protein [Burkholderiales bacterium]|nr:PAS domain S-box protein [Anaerolineae bacterium]
MADDLIRVLVVDDVEDDYIITRDLLREVDERRFVVDWIPTYDAALMAIERRQHDIYLIDYGLGLRDGVQLLREARAQGSDAPMILFTNNNNKQIDLEAMKAGAVDYLIKGEIDARLLERSIRYAIEREQALIKLRESEERYRSVVNNIMEVIFQTDAAGVLTFVNPAWTEITGHRIEDTIGRSILDFIHPGDRKRKEEMFMSLVQREMNDCRQEIRYQTASSGSRWMLVYGRAELSANGEFTGVSGTLTDISSHKRIEAELNRYVDQLTALRKVDAEVSSSLDIGYVISVALDTALRLSNANAGFIALTEDERGQLTLGTAIGQFPDTLEEHLRSGTGIIGRVMDKRQAELVPNLRADKEYIELAADARASISIPLISQTREQLIGLLHLESPRPERFTPGIFEFLKLITARIAVAIDNARLYQITRQQLAELQALYAQVSALEQIKTDMIRIAAHDLRNPLNIVTGYMDILEDVLAETLTTQQRGFFDMMRRSTSRMQKITTDILSLERIEAMQRVGVGATTVDLYELVERAYRDHRDQSIGKKQNFTLNAPMTVAKVRGDSAQLYEAVVNLITNAIRYTPEGGKIAVQLGRESEIIVFEVHDTGYGVPEDQQAQLFRPFFRARSDETNGIDGTGLGLHLVKNIIERHHGIMRFHSVHGQGSTFGFALPLMT